MPLSSLAANVLLAGLLIFLWSRPDSSEKLPAAPIALRQPEVVSPSRPAPVAIAPVRFTWHDLEAQDFTTFIANLRAIQCPEPTVRDIVKGELDEIYADKRRQIPRLSNAKLNPQLTLLSKEEDQLLAQLLGLAPTTDGNGVGPSAPQRRTPLEKIQMSLPLAEPLVFQTPDPKILPLTAEQAALMDQLKKDFLEQVGGSAQNPEDPAYLRRWTKAQFEVDTRLRTLMGEDFYMRYAVSVGHR